MSPKSESRPENSTNVRSHKERAFAAVLRTGGHVAPGWTTDIMMKLFTTTRRGEPSARALEALHAGRGFAVDGPTGPIRGWTFGDEPRPAIWLVHGWNGRATQMTGWIEPLLQRGYRVVLFDLPGHGESAGDRAHVGLFVEAIARVHGHFGPAHGVIAHSLGAAGIAVALNKGLLQASRLALVAPSAEPLDFVREYIRTALGSPRLEARFMARVDEEVGLTAHEVDIPSHRLNVPTLVVHDDDDAEIPVAVAHRLAKGWQDTTVWTTRGLGHRRILRDTAVIDATTAFLADGVRPVAAWGCSCGAGGADCEQCALDRELFNRSQRAA